MRNINLFEYPKKLNIIFDKLNKYNIKSIIVGGYIRDYFLNISAIDKKDIDIELYGVSSYDILEEILEEFGNVNTVGKSFGVCKLSFLNIEIDFTLPRTDNKISSGHSGFEVDVNKTLSFKEASSRRDFTINTIGFDCIDKIILDPFNGLEDIEKKILRAVDIEKFSEDPLRVLRLVSFKSRFQFNVDENLFLLCKTMCDENILSELPKERMFIEIKKVLLKSQKPSLGFILLKDLNALKYFKALEILNEKQFTHIIHSLDRFVKIKTKDNKTNTIIMLSILCYYFNTLEVQEFVLNLTNSKSLTQNILSLVQENFKTSYSDSELNFLATRVNIQSYLLFIQAISPFLETNIFVDIKERAIRLNILNHKAKALIQGRDIMAFGITPSPEYSKILSKAYEVQMNLEINNISQAKKWLKNYLTT